MARVVSVCCIPDRRSWRNALSISVLFMIDPLSTLITLGRIHGSVHAVLAVMTAWVNKTSAITPTCGHFGNPVLVQTIAPESPIEEDTM
jgi:hypothetical protein